MNTPEQRLMRSRDDRWIAGVAGGISRYIEIDPLIPRLAFILLTLSGVGPLVYVVLWLVMPREPKHQASTAGPHQPHPPHVHQAARPDSEPAAAQPAGGTRHPRFDPATGQPLDAAGEIPVREVRTGQRSPPAAQRKGTLGTVLIIIGAFLLLSKMMPWIHPYVFPVLLIGAGLLLIRRSMRVS